MSYSQTCSPTCAPCMRVSGFSVFTIMLCPRVSKNWPLRTWRLMRLCLFWRGSSTHIRGTHTKHTLLGSMYVNWPNPGASYYCWAKLMRNLQVWQMYCYTTSVCLSQRGDDGPSRALFRVWHPPAGAFAAARGGGRPAQQICEDLYSKLLPGTLWIVSFKLLCL